MKKLLLLMLMTLAAGAAHAQNGCGATRNWTDPLCQQIASGSLGSAIVNGSASSSAWSVISRHGEYLQSESECNVPGALSVISGYLYLTTTASAYSCGNFIGTGGTIGQVDTAAASWPYQTGDLEWNTFNFKYGTVIIRQKIPAQNTGLWVGEWLLGTNCQTSNKYTGETGSSYGCPSLNNAAYNEYDLLETKYPNPAGQGWGNEWVDIGGGPGSVCVMAQSPIDGTSFHTYAWNWTASAYTSTIDGVTTGCSYGSINANMFLILQIQTCGSNGTGGSTCNSMGSGGPPTDANLPASLQIDYVKVCDSTLTATQCNTATGPGDPTYGAHVIFYDDFAGVSTFPHSFGGGRRIGGGHSVQ